jgi:threonine dehydrogenase-like Zn-dependent dehydrogenase
MKALVYHGPRTVSVDSVPDAKIKKPTEAIIRLTIINLCGSDLHMYEGRTDVANQAPEAYKHFDQRDDGWTKVVLRPAA